MNFSFSAGILSYLATLAGTLLGLLVAILLFLPFATRVFPQITLALRRMRGDAVPTPPGPACPKEAEGWALVLSDLHIDTWGDGLLQPRTQALGGILDWADGKVRRLILNGDLLDLPPHPNNQVDPDLLTIPRDWPDAPIQPAINLENPCEAIRPGSLQGRYATILTKLFSPLGPHKIGLVGNHDMGINGLRFIAVTGKAVNWSPGVLIETPEKGKYVYVEHGHRHDPYLWIYTIYALIDILRGETSASGGQRGGRVGKAGNEHKRTVVEEAVKVDTYDPTDPLAGLTGGQKNTLWAYRAAAYRRLRKLRACGIEVTAILMGHTHLPDRFQLDKDCLYVNIGDWAGNGNHQTFAVIAEDGRVLGPYQWQ